jgi:hypothetical protein
MISVADFFFSSVRFMMVEYEVGLVKRKKKGMTGERCLTMFGGIQWFFYSRPANRASARQYKHQYAAVDR